jgi:hypothetical protein
MRLNGEEGNSVTLDIEDYQFPEAADPNQKYSWHMIKGRADRAGASRSFRYPALTCDETPKLSVWLRAVADWVEGVAERVEPLRFTEPNLGFDLIQEEPSTVASIRITLEQEFVAPEDTRAGKHASHVLLAVGAAHLRAAAADWDLAFEQYPDRLAW